MPDYGSGVRLFCNTLTWRQQRRTEKDLTELRQRVARPSKKTDTNDNSANPKPDQDADDKSWEDWAFAERRAFRNPERRNAAGQIEEFVQLTVGHWSHNGGNCDKYTWRVVPSEELKRREAAAEKTAEDETDLQPGPPSALRSYQGTQTLWTDE